MNEITRNQEQTFKMTSSYLKYYISQIITTYFFTAGTQVRSVDVHKHAIKSDRKIKEMEFTTDENHKNIDRMSELVDKLQGKIRT